MANYGRYQLLEKIGEGSMGMVYLAHDPKIDRKVALKVIRKDHISNTYFLQRFYKEAKAIGRISHPNIVTVYDIGTDHGKHFIAMEYIEGMVLNQVIEKGALAFETVLEIGMKLAEALDFAHQKGIIHRDIKPSNIIMKHSKEPVITDFGIAHVDDPEALQQTQVGEVLGTPRYMSPEQVLGQSVDGRSDLYALGLILHQLATGRHPLKTSAMPAVFHAIVNGDYKLTQVNDPNATDDQKKAFEQILLQVLEKNPDDRFQNGRQLSMALKTCLGAPLDNQYRTDINQEIKSERSKRLRRAAYLAAFFVLTGLLVLAGFSTLRSLITPDHLKTGPKQLKTSSTVKMTTVLIQSDPQGSQVFINEELKGTTPLKLELPSGLYRVVLRMKGHFDWEKTLDLTAATSDPLHVKLEPLVF